MHKDTFDAVIFSKGLRCVLDNDINGYCYGLEERDNTVLRVYSWYCFHELDFISEMLG